MNLQDLINGRLGVGLGLSLSRSLPPKLAYPVIRMFSGVVARQQNSPMVQAIRANQWIISGKSLTGRELNERTHLVLQNTGRSIYDFYHYMHDSPKVKELVPLDPSFEPWMELNLQQKQPMIWVAPHLSNFDLMARALILKGARFQVLSYPQPNAGYRWQNQIRELPGLELTPMSIAALRQASNNLRANGTILTGVDRPLPDPDSKYQPTFFGLPASLPVFHIRLALKHDLPIVVISGKRTADGKMTILASDPIPMQHSTDLYEETVCNAEAVLAAIEHFVCLAPEQWAMFYPIWPEASHEVPNSQET